MSWINGNGFIPNDGLNGSAAPWPVPNAGGGWTVSAGQSRLRRLRPGEFGRGAGRPGSAVGDPSAALGAFGSTLPGGAPNPYAGGGISAILAQLSNQVQQLDRQARQRADRDVSLRAGAAPANAVGDVFERLARLSRRSAPERERHRAERRRHDDRA